MTDHDPQAVKARYARRNAAADEARYSLYANAAALQAQQERLRAMARIWQAHGWTGLELLPERAAAARASQPSDVTIVEGDAALAPVQPASQDAVLAFTLFSSLLDEGYRRHLADVIWQWVAPGGGGPAGVGDWASVHPALVSAHPPPDLGREAKLSAASLWPF